MNPKLLELAKQCGYWSGQTVEMNDVGVEKFAKMIAQDCISQIALIGISNDEHEDVMWAVNKSVNTIKERYGIES